MLQTLRRVAGTLVVDVPQEFIDRNALIEGSRLKLHLVGRRMIVEAPARPRHAAAELIAEMRDELPRVGHWEELRAVEGKKDSGGVRSVRDGLLRFAASQENVDRMAMRRFVCVAAFGTLVAIATIAAMIGK